MRVLVVIDSLRVGGAENLLVHLAGPARQAGLDVDVVSLGPPEGPQASLAGALSRAGLPPRFLGARRLADPAAAYRLAAEVRRSGCDVVHAHLEHASVLAPVAGRLAGRPVVCTFHQLAGGLTGSEAVKERLAVACAGTARATVFVSEACRRSFAQRYRPRANWTVLPNGVDLSAFADPAPRLLPAGLGVPAGARVVTVVAALRPPKGHRVLLEAWPAVRRRVPDAHLLVVGDGDAGPALRRQAGELGLRDAVTFAGARDDVPALLAGSALVVLPTFTEALPTVLAEAGAAGRAVVASAVGGVPEVVLDGVTGVLVPPGDPVSLAAAVGDLLTDPARAAAMGAAARRRVQERFGTGTWLAGLLQLYQEAAGHRPADAGGPPSQDASTRSRSHGRPASRS